VAEDAARVAIDADGDGFGDEGLDGDGVVEFSEVGAGGRRGRGGGGGVTTKLVMSVLSVAGCCWGRCRGGGWRRGSRRPRAGGAAAFISARKAGEPGASTIPGGRVRMRAKRLRTSSAASPGLTASLWGWG